MCYTVSEAPVCGLEEYTHTEACYAQGDQQDDQQGDQQDEENTLTVTGTDKNGNPVEEPRQLYDKSFLAVKDKYAMFLGGQQSLGVIRTGREGPKLLLIRDSYTDSLAPFLTAHYSEIHLIDLRYYKLSVADYIKQNGIDAAVVLYSVPNFVTDSNLVWLGR